jgi:four helix bundle protein
VWNETQEKILPGFCTSKGSCGELRTQIYIGVDIDYIEPAVGKKWIQESKELSAMLVGLRKSLKEDK